MPATSSCRTQLATAGALNAFIDSLLGALDGGGRGELQRTEAKDQGPGTVTLRRSQHLKVWAWARREAVLSVRTGRPPLPVASCRRLRGRAACVPHRTAARRGAERAGWHRRAGTAGGRRLDAPGADRAARVSR